MSLSKPLTKKAVEDLQSNIDLFHTLCMEYWLPVDISREMNFEPEYLNAACKTLFGVSSRDYIIKTRKDAGFPTRSHVSHHRRYSYK